MKLLGPLLILGVFLVAFLVMYMQKRKPAPQVPGAVGVPPRQYPSWRILPYDPYKIGQPPVYDPSTLHLGDLAPRAPGVWSSSYTPSPYSIPG